METTVGPKSLMRIGLSQLAGDRKRPTVAPESRLDALMLVTRAGLMLQGWRRSGQKFDPDSIASMMTAVSAFVQDSIGDDPSPRGWRAETFSVGRRSFISIGAGGLIASAIVDGVAGAEVSRELKRMVSRSAPDYASSTQGKGGWVQTPGQRQAFEESLVRLVPEATIDRTGSAAVPADQSPP